MTERVQVPQGMLEAAWNIIDRSDFDKTVGKKEELRIALKAGLAWLQSHPIVPSEKVAYDLWSDNDVGLLAGFTEALKAWSGRMFAPEPEVPEAETSVIAGLEGVLEPVLAHLQAHHIMPSDEQEPDVRCSVCNAAIWQTKEGDWSHFAAYPDHAAEPKPEVIPELMALIPPGHLALDKGLDNLLLEAYRLGIERGQKGAK